MIFIRVLMVPASFALDLARDPLPRIVDLFFEKLVEGSEILLFGIKMRQHPFGSDVPAALSYALALGITPFLETGKLPGCSRLS